MKSFLFHIFHLLSFGKTLTAQCIVASVFFSFPLVAQQPSFKTPYKLDEAINSLHEESRFFISEDISTLVFTREESDQNEGNPMLYLATKNNDGIWNTALKFPESAKSVEDEMQVVGMTSTGNFYFLENTASKSSKLYVQYCKNEFCINHLKSVKIPLQAREALYIYVHPSDSIMLLSLMSSEGIDQGAEDLYVSLKDEKGMWNKPINLGVTINSEYSEITPFLSFDKQRLFFSSNKEGDKEGFEIYYADRLYDSWILWTVPRNLGKPINTSADEKFFYLHEDAAYFISNKEDNDNIYKSQKIEFNPFIDLNNNQ